MFSYGYCTPTCAPSNGAAGGSNWLAIKRGGAAKQGVHPLCGLSVMCQFVTSVPVRDKSGFCGKSTVFTHKFGFGGVRKEGGTPMYQYFKKKKAKNRQANMMHTIELANSSALLP